MSCLKSCHREEEAVFGVYRVVFSIVGFEENGFRVERVILGYFRSFSRLKGSFWLIFA